MRDALVAEDSLIKYARDEAGAANWNPALHPRTGTAPNPGWFAPTDGQSSAIQTAGDDDPNQGSDAQRPDEDRLRSKTPKSSSSPPMLTEREVARPPIEGEIIRPPIMGESTRGEIARTPLEIELEAARVANRRAFRITAIAVLRMSAEAAANIVPILDAIADAMLAVDAINLAIEWQKLKVERQAAFDFIKKAPYSLDELQVRSPLGYEEFSSYDMFTKIALEDEDLSKRFGSAGAGYQYHHVVTQGGENATKIPPAQLQNTDNIIRLPTLIHEAVTARYAEVVEQDLTKTLCQWLQTQPYDVQRAKGIEILRELGILK